MYRIEQTKKEIIIRFDGDLVDEQLITKMLEYFEFRQSLQEGILSIKQSQRLAKEINQNVWDKLKNKVIEDKNNKVG